MKKVYISSAFTTGWQLHNMRNQMLMAAELKKLGYLPFIPLLFPFFEFAVGSQFSDREMLDWELAYIGVCDMLVRIRFRDAYGVEIPSSGADEEVAEARRLNIPVYIFNSIEEMIKHFKEYSYEKRI